MQFQDLYHRSWEVLLFHYYRETNCVADYLANLGHSLNFDRGLSRWLQYDLIGVSLSRQVRVLNNI
ncbi:hypothetical protein LINGRAHAP2_LOCUS24446 [Linum grandiflorum]